MPTPEYHAELSPSSADRWLHCPPSYLLGRDMPRTTSSYAEAGRLAHSIAELKARKKFIEPMGPRKFAGRLKKLQEDAHYEKVMDGYTDAYVEALEQHAMSFQAPPFIALETEVPIGLITGERKPDGTPAGGTADCIQIAEGVLWVTDYKNGSGTPVEAEENPQMKLYALAALALYRPFYGDTIQTIRMTIVQPALGGVSDWEISREALEAWGRNVVGPAAAQARAGEGEQKSGRWCKFCPVAATCRARANDAEALREAFGMAAPAGNAGAMAGEDSDARLLSDAEVGEALRRGAELVAWYNSLKDYALSTILAGGTIPGWKAVEGRGSRKWDDPDTALQAMIANGVPEAMLWERKPVTPPALEKALGKKPFATFAASHVVQERGKPALAEAGDKRAEYNPAAVAFGGAANGG